MAVFAYRAVDQLGRESAGTVSADNRAAAVEQVIQRGFTPVLVQESRPEQAAPLSSARPTGRVPASQVEAFTREMANLLSAGVPLSRALNIVIRETSIASARAQWTAVHDDVVSGSSLAEALAKWPKTFPRVYVAMVRAGETGGFLDTVLAQISDFQVRERDLKGKVQSALVYPMVLAVLASAVMVFLLTYFIPRFALIFQDFGGNLPALTRAIVAASDLLMRHGGIVLLAAIVLGALAKRAQSSPRGRRALEKIMLRTPLLGPVIARFALVRFCRMLGTLLGAGVGLINALHVAKEAVGNQTLTDLVSVAIEEVQKGASLSRSLAVGETLFPASVAEMVAIAEETGRLDKELLRISSAFEGDLDRRLRMLVTLAEPLLLFVMAAVIGTVVVGMLLPLFQLQDLVR